MFNFCLWMASFCKFLSSSSCATLSISVYVVLLTSRDYALTRRNWYTYSTGLRRHITTQMVSFWRLFFCFKIVLYLTCPCTIFHIITSIKHIKSNSEYKKLEAGAFINNGFLLIHCCIVFWQWWNILLMGDKYLDFRTLDLDKWSCHG